MDPMLLFSALELPFLLVTVIYSFRVARAMRGGAFGAGMRLVAWGFLVMAVGHLHMQYQHLTGTHLFKSLLGETGGQAAWFAALITTWGLTAFGFFAVERAARGKG